MAQAVSVSVCRPVYLDSPCNPLISWIRRHAMFCDYLLAMNFPTEGEHQARKAVWVRGLRNIGFTASVVTYPRKIYDTAVTHLTMHFDQRSNSIFERTQFTHRFAWLRSQGVINFEQDFAENFMHLKLFSATSRLLTYDGRNFQCQGCFNITVCNAWGLKVNCVDIFCSTDRWFCVKC